MLHQGDTFYKRRSNNFTTIVLQELRIQGQGLDRKLQDCVPKQNWGFSHLDFIIYYQATIRRSFTKQYNYPTCKAWPLKATRVVDLWGQALRTSKSHYGYYTNILGYLSYKSPCKSYL